MMQPDEIQLHDIKPIIDIQEYSLYYFLGVVGITLLLIFAVGYLLYIWFQKKNKFNIRKEHKEMLFSLNLQDTKKSAYAITLYGTTFKNDSTRHEESYHNLVSRLEPYKYKKAVEAFDKETLNYFELYKEMCDV